MEVLIVYEGKRGSAQRTAEALEQAVGLHGHLGRCSVLEETSPDEIAAADAVLVGCWSEAAVPFGGDATDHLVTWIDGLPSLRGKPLGAFCAYSALPHPFADPAAHAAETLDALRDHLAARGASVAATQAFHRIGLDREAASFVDAVLAAA